MSKEGLCRLEAIKPSPVVQSGDEFEDVGAVFEGAGGNTNHQPEINGWNMQNAYFAKKAFLRNSEMSVFSVFA